MSEAMQPLQAVSNVIELKPGKKYLLVFKGERIHHDELEHVASMLSELGIECLGVALSDGQELTVIEAPAEPKEG